MAMADKNVSYTDVADDTAHDSVTGITHNPGTEPATTHDTTEGGVLGAVGGAVVGLFAGGPIGAVIGAIAGGAASAAAVNVVDKHDHDYDRTVGTGNSDAVGAGYSDDSDPALAGTQGSGATMTGAYSTSMAPAYNAAVAQNTGTQNTAAIATNGETVIPIVEEELEVGKRQVQSGGAHIRTGVTETPVSEQVTLREEHVNVTRHAVNEPVMDGAAAFKEQSFEVTETDEVPVVSKTARVVEEVVVGKTATERTETIRDTVRRTDVEVDDLGTDTTRR